MFDKKIKILIVDDMPTMRKVLAKNLSSFGFYDFVEAADGVEAWAKISASESPFALIISDFEMPHCNGIDLLKRLRGDGRFSQTPFILVATPDEKDKLDEAIQVGLNSILYKPYTNKHLTDALNEAHKDTLKK